MTIRVTLGAPFSTGAAAREEAVSLGSEDSETSITLAELAHRLNIRLEDSEGSLMVFVNGKVVPSVTDHALRLQNGDRVELFVPLAGG